MTSPPTIVNLRGGKMRGIKTKIRLHHKDGRIIAETLAHMARENGCTVAEARTLIRLWCAEGALSARTDGGFDVVRFKGRGVDVNKVRRMIAVASQAGVDVGDIIAATVVAGHVPAAEELETWMPAVEAMRGHV